MRTLGLFLIGTLLAATSVLAEDKPVVVVRVVNGKTGKPVAKQRVVIFQGTTEQEVREQRSIREIDTDADGVATLQLFDPTIQFVQGSADHYVLCQRDPKDAISSVERIKGSGLNAENSCGKYLRMNDRNEFTLYVRRATLWEQLRENFWFFAPRINPKI